ncbi:hypothetical protein PIB30_001894 [Stylosanthes scabra]|uniref:Bifunctional inhibitor/plant lipid transfer protein/seed storage helical domain-containing protein n=1 Tax=Stylosanthes scabra TaxID=79078 RepID=A0ABU6X4M0_9FABA|nr:hypothetical protein [Stylosanthes scabra]
MAKLRILVALLAVLLVAEVASATRWDPSEWDPRGPSEWDPRRRGDDERCERQVDRADLSPCEEHIRQRVEDEQDQYPYNLPDRRRRHRGGYDDEQQERCCNELNRFENNERCMCQALQEIFQNQNYRFQQDRSQRHQLEREVRNLPQNCGFSSPDRCNLNNRRPY